MKTLITISFIALSYFSIGQNHIDKDGNKQGPWAIEVIDTLTYIIEDFGRESVELRDSTGYKKYTKLEGQYLNNMKTGIWISYGRYNYKLSTITLLDGKPDGEVVVYYRNGSIMYKGNIEKDSETVQLQTKAAEGKYYSTVTLNVDEIIDKWTYINE